MGLFLEELDGEVGGILGTTTFREAIYYIALSLKRAQPASTDSADQGRRGFSEEMKSLPFVSGFTGTALRDVLQDTAAALLVPFFFSSCAVKKWQKREESTVALSTA
ncbi:hypothetical protein ACJX0J_020166, partial [Zea mays]